MTYWEVNIVSWNKKGKVYEDQYYSNSLLDAVRVVISYKVKRGYEVMKYSLEKVEKLV